MPVLLTQFSLRRLQF